MKAREKASKCRYLSASKIESFRAMILGRYRESGREFAWRKTRNPYRILVSEFMLQQTQTERVARYYEVFLKRFPNFRALADATLRDVLDVWQGLGYNRRARFLLDTARVVVLEHRGELPSDIETLRALPGVGPATAAAIAAFAYNQPVILLETNIRRVFIDFFFARRKIVRDREILPLVEATLDRSNPRRWYYALMDYGVLLKKSGPNANRRSAHYQKQPPFNGSNRQLRGAILKILLANGKMTREALAKELRARAGELDAPLAQLVGEGLVKKIKKCLVLAED